MSARLAILPGPGARAVGVPARPSSWRLRGSLRYLDPRPGSNGGYCRRDQPLSSGAAEYPLSLVRASRPEATGTLLASAGFRDTRVEREIREYIIHSFDDYWESIEAGIGSLPQAYLSLAEADR